MTSLHKELVTEDLITAALMAPVPGGSEVWCWLPQKDAWTPHRTARDVMRCALEAAFKAAADGPSTGQDGHVGAPGNSSNSSATKEG